MFLKIHRCEDRVCVNGSFKFILGVNYWPRELAVDMWRKWSRESVARDVAMMRELGVEFIRAFIIGEDFVGEDGDSRSDAVEKLLEFLDIISNYGIKVFLTLLVGHMSGKNFKLPWVKSGVYSKEDLELTLKFIRGIVERVKDHPALAGWILSNELSLYEAPKTIEEALAFLKETSKVVKSIDREHLFSSGDVPSSVLQDPLFTRGLVDYVGPHLYFYDSDEVRHGYTYTATLELFRDCGEVPVILEEFGFSTHQFSEESHAVFVREVLYTALAHGASGALIWCFSDFDLENTPPYSWRPLELGFGLVKASGEYKLSAKIFKEFARERGLLEGLINGATRVSNAVILVNYCAHRAYPFTWCSSIPRETAWWNLVKMLSSAYTLFSYTTPGPLVVHEESFLEKSLPSEVSLIAYPSVIEALAPTWRKLLELAESGVVVYASVMRGLGNIMNPHTSPTHLWSEVFGVEPSLEAGGLGKYVYGSYTLTLAKDLKVLKCGARIKLEVPTPLWLYRVRPVDADILAVDEGGEPVLFVARRGGGYTVLSLIPVEAMLASSFKVDYSSNVFKLYKDLFSSLGIISPINLHDPRLDAVIYRCTKHLIVFIINHSYEKIVSKLTTSSTLKAAEKLTGNGVVVEVEGKEVVFEILGKSALILKLTSSVSEG